MSDEDLTYRVTLAPAGVDAADAEETRTFTFTLDEEGETDLVAAAITHIRDNDLIDDWALRAHWDIDAIARLEDEEQDSETNTQRTTSATRLHAALHGAAYTTTALSRSYTSTTITIRDPHTGNWKPTTLAIKPHVKRDYHTWRQTLTSNHRAVANKPSRVLHEAMVQVAANVKPTLANEFDSSPLDAQNEFVQIALSHPNRIVKAVEQIDV